MLTRHQTSTGLRLCSSCPLLTPRCRRKQSLVVLAAAKNKACTVSVDPLEPTPMVCNGPTCRIPLTIFALSALGAAYWFKRQVQSPSKKLPEPWPQIPRPEADPEGYKKALARTRQAQDVARAVTFMHNGEPARAMVEMHKALEENEVCRSPLLDGHHDKCELVSLYKLHIHNAECPPSYPLLLQLRLMLGLPHEEAEQIEAEVLREAEAFSI
eukprot:GHUV01004019.1.p1 GENE.GHUV01004019.1~~GHUV01004019.1.p1  ORF type:complete len:213 (+),score=17.12 GHUV01004019.1:148-786(+)